MKVDLYDTSGKKIDKLELPETIFKAKINQQLMTQAVRVYLANQRQGTQSAKTRGEVTGSGKKIYRQKGTGGARHGDRYAPIFVGGGVAFPPKPRDFSLKISKKMKRLALFSSLTQKLNENAVIVIDGLEKIKAKTKEMVNVLSGLSDLGSKKILLVLPEKLENVILAARNIKMVTLTPVALLNTYAVLNTDKIIFLKDSIEKLSRVFLKNGNAETPKEMKQGKSLEIQEKTVTFPKKEIAVKKRGRPKKNI